MHFLHRGLNLRPGYSPFENHLLQAWLAATSYCCEDKEVAPSVLDSTLQAGTDDLEVVLQHLQERWFWQKDCAQQSLALLEVVEP